jgi:3-hydroxyisobutyrate dehydrogenase-like beta-hydroxyacid dehydrogenase
VAAEAYALAKAAGADLDVLMDVMPQTSADSWQLRNTLIKKVLNNDFSPMFKLGLARKDMRLIAEMAADLGVDVPCARASLEGYDRAADAGLGDLDWGAVILNSNPELRKPE